ncbi:MAG: hypothetical protein R3305_11565, partial [Gammaproteobacteria bacterium]|nr:hypothetical protein [Gammaproteobacteria bacterium]
MVEQRDKSKQRPAGHVTVDSRGRNVWQWDDKQLDSTTIMLRRLDNPELELEATRRLRKPDQGRSIERGSKSKPKSNSPDDVSLSIEQTID